MVEALHSLNAEVEEGVKNGQDNYTGSGSDGEKHFCDGAQPCYLSPVTCPAQPARGRGRARARARLVQIRQSRRSCQPVCTCRKSVRAAMGVAALGAGICGVSALQISKRATAATPEQAEEDGNLSVRAGSYDAAWEHYAQAARGFERKRTCSRTSAETVHEGGEVVFEYGTPS